MRPIGTIHVAFGIAALGLGLVIFSMTKGTRLHRRLGYLYVASMLGLNVTALLIYEFLGFFGPFHAAALFSLASVAVGLLPAWSRRPPQKWLQRHYDGMSVSYVGLLAATAAEIAIRTPIVGRLGLSIGMTTAVASFLTIVAGAFVQQRYRDRVLARFQPAKRDPGRTQGGEGGRVGRVHEDPPGSKR